jgi:hypothetical protein
MIFDRSRLPAVRSLMQVMVMAADIGRINTGLAGGIVMILYKKPRAGF